jgi:hypothetical protein
MIVMHLAMNRNDKKRKGPDSNVPNERRRRRKASISTVLLNKNSTIA